MAVVFLAALLASCMARVAYFLLLSSLLLSFGVYMGWIQRWIWILIEKFLSFLLNGAPVTIGSLEIDWWRGHVLATNCVVHTPCRDTYKWDSPLIVRVGRCYLEVDTIGYLLDRIYYFFETPKVDIYTAEFSDIQVFVERRQHVFNFYLLDSMVELPDPKELMAKEEEEQVKQQRRATSSGKRGEGGTPLRASLQAETASRSSCDAPSADSPVRENNGTTSASSSSNSSDGATSEQRQAQEIVDHLFQSLKSIGQAAQRGGWKGALFQQRETLTQTLQQFQQESKKVDAMQEGVRVIRQVGESIAKQPLRGVEVPVPKRREDEEPPPNVRVGRVVVKEARIFTRDNWDGVAESSVPSETSSSSSWNKPICLESVVVRASELCPPMSLLDENGLPAIYQPLDKVVEVVWKRLLSSMAKSQTGRLFNTALGEVLGFMKLSRKNNGSEGIR